MTLDEQIVEKMIEVQQEINAGLKAVCEGLATMGPALVTLAENQRRIVEWLHAPR